jgi:hypothetical protein
LLLRHPHAQQTSPRTGLIAEVIGGISIPPVAPNAQVALSANASNGADVLDALKDNPASLNFYIGHELGHLQRKHLAWKPLLLPSSFLPLLGAAYHRACEYTCDRHGLACSESPTAAQQGLLAIATAFARQVEESTGFWMSFHEFIGDYPWLAKRVSAVNALARYLACAQLKVEAVAYIHFASFAQSIEQPGQRLDTSLL